MCKKPPERRKVGDTLTATVEGAAAASYQWYADDEEIEGADEATLLITEDMVGAIISVTAFAEDGETAIATCTEAVILSDTDAPEILDSEVVDAWTLGVLFDEDVFKGDDYSLTVTLAGEDVDVDETIDGAAMTLVKADGSSFAAGEYTVTITDLEDESGNAADELNATITKDNSYAAAFGAYEGYMAEYNKVDEKQDPVQGRKIHVVVTDQYGETMSGALSATYGAVKSKATIKSTGSLIASTFNKTGEEIDGQTMAYVNIGADKECVGGETLVVELTNTIDGEPFVSSFEVAIVGYDLVDTADTVTALTQTTLKSDVNAQFVEGIDGGVLKMSDNNEVGLVATVVDFTGATATKGMVKFVSSDPSVIKVAAETTKGGTYRDNVIVDAHTKANGYNTAYGYDDAAFGVWFKALKPGAATITAYATGNIEDAYTFTVEVEGAELAIAGTDAYNGEISYLPLTGTDGLDDATYTGTIGGIWTEDDEGNRTTFATSPTVNPYLATGSKKDRDNGLTKGEMYLEVDARPAAFKVQKTFVYTVSARAVAGTTTAETEEIEVYMRPRVKVDSDVQATSGIFVGANNQAATAASAVLPTKAANGVDKIEDKTGNATTGLKGVPIYAAINVVNTVPMEIGNYAAGQIKYTWSEDTVGSAKVNISNESEITAVNTNLTTNGTALLTITPTTPEVIGKLTLSIGGTEKELKVHLGKAVASGTIEGKWKDEGKAALITGTDALADKTFVAPSTAADHKVELTIKDQYGAEVDPSGIGVPGPGEKTALRVADATWGGGKFTIANELEVTIAKDATGKYSATFSNMAPGEHEITFFVGERTTVSSGDPQTTVAVNFVQKKDLTSVVPQAGVDWTAATTLSDWAGVKGKFGDAVSLTSDAVAAGMFLDTKATSTLTTSAKVYAGETEVTGVPLTWSILDENFSFTETWIEDTQAGTAAGSQTITSTGAGLTGEWATVTDAAKGEITLDVTGTTGLDVTAGAGKAYDDTAALTRDATLKGDWTTSGGALTLGGVMAYVALADSGESATLTATVHMNVQVDGTDLDAQSYLDLSTAGMSCDVDDIYLAYGANTKAANGVEVDENEAVGDAIKVKAGNANGTKVRVVAVDSVYGATLYDEDAAALFVNAVAATNTTPTNGLIVGTDADAVVANGCEATVAAGIVTVKADTGTNGKTASLRLPVKSGGKNAILTVALDIV